MLYFVMNRLHVAALHYNENANRGQAETKGGKLRYKVRYPKFKKGEAIITKVMKNPTFSEFEVKF